MATRSKKAKDAAEDVAGTHHGPPLPAYFAIFGTLMVLTGVTVWAAYLDLGRWSAFVAVGIAAVKATLVLLYFMHLKYSSRLVALHASAGFLFLAILLGITMSEVAGRQRAPVTDPLRSGQAPPVPKAAPLEPP